MADNRALKQLALARRVNAQLRRADAFASGKAGAKPYSPSMGEYRPKAKPVVDARPKIETGMSNPGRLGAPKPRRSSDAARQETERMMREGKPGRPRK